MIDIRQETILKLIIDDYIQKAEPVGSRFLSNLDELDVSPATIRNDMVVLEQEGYIYQPHISAGRIPTEKAYIYYLQHFIDDSKKNKHNFGRSLGQDIKQEQAERETIKILANSLMDLSGEMAIAAFDGDASYYTGVANLFSKPDFCNLRMIKTLSVLVDQFDDVMLEMFDQIKAFPEVKIGSQNPFGSDMSSIMIKFTLPSGQTGLLGLVGPMRMDYTKNIQLLERAKEILDDYEKR